jgi:hypothetical protein
MGEMTGEMLIAYADANGLKIMSHRNPDLWADNLNKNSGKCPCGKECPCDDCTCLFYITDSKPIEAPIEEEMIAVDIKLPELAHAVDTLEKVKTGLMEMDNDNINGIRETISSAVENIREDAKQHKCNGCAEYMEGLARKLNFLKEECAIDGRSCEVESRMTVNRINEMQEIFVAVDKEISEQAGGEENNEAETTNDTNQETTKRPDSQLPARGDTSHFHECITKTTLGQLQEIDRTKRICTASKMCGAKKLSKEEAIRQCVGDKK